MFQLYILAVLCACLDLNTADEWGNVDWGSLQGDWSHMDGDWGAMETGAGMIPSWDHRKLHTIKGGPAPWAENVYHFRNQAQKKLKSDYRPRQTNTLLNSMTAGQRKNTQTTMWDAINNSQKLHALNQAIDASTGRLAAIDRAIESQRLEALKREIDTPRHMNWDTNTNTYSSQSPDSLNQAFGASHQSRLSQNLAAVHQAIQAGKLAALKESIDTLTPAQKAENRRKQFQSITNDVGLGIMSLGSMANQPFGMLPWDMRQGAGYRLDSGIQGRSGGSKDWMTIAQGIASPFIPQNVQDLTKGLGNLFG